MQPPLPGFDGPWDILRGHAPYLLSVMEKLVEFEFESPDPLDLPSVLNLQPRRNFSSVEEWQQYLDSEHRLGLSVREVYLRVLLVYVVSDQGADIPGVRLFMNHFITRCYEEGILLFHEMQGIGDPRIIAIADEGARLAFEERSEIWSQTGRRSASTYSVFTVDNVRGRPSANWYVNSRIAPALSIPLQIDGGLTTLVSSMSSREGIRNVIRQDTKHGMFYALGEKALDLYIKWIFGTFKLVPEGVGIDPRNLPIPMDQRVGRVMMRIGFMDELFDMEACIESGKFLLERNGGPAAKNGDDGPPRDRVFLRVTDFRRHGRVKADLVPILNLTRPVIMPGRVLAPQIALICLLRLFSQKMGRSIHPHEFDDMLMNIATICTDRDPQCTRCPVSEQCQANNEKGMDYLKLYYT